MTLHQQVREALTPNHSWVRYDSAARCAYCGDISHTAFPPSGPCVPLGARLRRMAENPDAQARRALQVTLVESADALAALTKETERLKRELANTEQIKSEFAACFEYLKDGETVPECIERNRNDIDALMTLYLRAFRRAEEAEAALARVRTEPDARPERTEDDTPLNLSDANDRWNKMALGITDADVPSSPPDPLKEPTPETTSTEARRSRPTGRHALRIDETPWELCDKCCTAMHCENHERCLAECSPADLAPSSPAQASWWQPIAAVPTDDSPVWLATRHWVAIGHTCGDGRFWTTHPPVTGQRIYREGVAELPTHWQPLPAPPSTEDGR